ncbi:Signal peptidase subunit [Geosmithia morbida]|uniref:Signal peptidase subunit 3 n=1 Tax=Geosmithia morbida TaxID=1094350 RepID=A0A9P4YRP5_9HYPO|nr:Signal peptidase subunit [Geosmithia morbida]KAF4120478.1 Signal peptidase subunit [Geosmithia morbida]
MYNSLTRLQTVFGFFTTFSLDADLSSLFTWNTKQLFVYVTAEWPAADPESPAGATNEAVIWDSIITSPSADHLSNLGPYSLKKLKKSAEGRSIAPERGLLHLKNQKPKYQITHPSGKIGDVKDVVLKLHYNVQPWFGFLSWNSEADYGRWKAFDGGVSQAFNLPPVKVKDSDSKKKSS